MEPGGRKLLPRVHPSAAERDHDPVEPTRNGSRVPDLQDGIPNPTWRSPVEEEPGHKRKRQAIEDPHSGSQALPSLRHLLTGPAQSQPLEAERTGHARVIRTGKGTYIHESHYKFMAPHPSRDFPASVSADTRELSFAVVEPDLMDIFRRAWYLRHYIRLKRLQGEHWLDHIFFNDSYGIENTLCTWTSRYEPGTLQYPASMLYKICVWLFFNRSIQASQPSPAFTQVVDDGLHFLHTLENALGATPERSNLLVPLFLLGIAAFYTNQRRDVWEALDQLDPYVSNESVNHAAKSLERLWSMMDDGRRTSTWDWERFQAHEYTMSPGDRSLIDLLWDPLVPVAQPAQPAQPAPPAQSSQPPPRVRTPDPHEFDPSRFRAVQSQAPPPAPPPPDLVPKPPLPETDTYTPPRPHSPLRHHSTTSTLDAGEVMRVDGHPEAIPGHVDMPSGARPFFAPVPLPPAAGYQPGHDAVQVLQRKTPKTKSSVPPCPTCGKELKNPSDAQKHQLQHSKPFRCREPNCTRTQGFATENDLQRHRKSVHGASPRIGNKIGYICAACPEPSDGTSRKWWPRLDNFKAHIRRKHQDQDEEVLINSSASARRPGDEIYTDGGYVSGGVRWPDDQTDGQSYHRDSTYEHDHDEHDHEDHEDHHDHDHDGEQDYGTGDEHHEHEKRHSQSDHGHTENSDDHASRTPKSDSEVSKSDRMDVSPTTITEQKVS